METVLLVVTVFALNGSTIDLKKSTTMTHVVQTFDECLVREKSIRAKLVRENAQFLTMCRYARPGEQV